MFGFYANLLKDPTYMCLRQEHTTDNLKWIYLFVDEVHVHHMRRSFIWNYTLGTQGNIEPKLSKLDFLFDRPHFRSLMLS